MCVDASGPPSFNLLNNLSLQMVVHFILVVLKSFVFKRKKVSLSYYGLVRIKLECGNIIHFSVSILHMYPILHSVCTDCAVMSYLPAEKSAGGPVED